MMDKRLPAVADQLLLIERELRLLGWWEAEPPSARALASEQPFCVDTLHLHQGLQWGFLPRMQARVETGQPLPAASGMREIAAERYAEQVAGAGPLLAALGTFDRLASEGDGVASAPGSPRCVADVPPHRAAAPRCAGVAAVRAAPAAPLASCSAVAVPVPAEGRRAAAAPRSGAGRRRRAVRHFAGGSGSAPARAPASPCAHRRRAPGGR